MGKNFPRRRRRRSQFAEGIISSNERVSASKRTRRAADQCDQIGQFFCTLGNHSKLVATIILSKSPTLVGNFCKGVKIIHFPIEIIFGNFYRHLAIFHLVTLSLGVSRDKISQVLVFRLQFVKSIHSVTTFYRARIPTYTNVDHVVLFSVRCAAFFVRFFGIKRWQFYNTTST